MSSQLLSGQQSVAVDAWARLLRSHTAMRRTLSADLQAEHGLTVNDYEALLLLSRAEDGRLRRVDLAEGLQLTPSGVTRLLDGLNDLGCVEKATCARDARVTYAVLTDAGREKLEQAASSHVAAIRALMEERFSEEELETFAELLARLPGAGGSESCTP
jgi:DNA-binding MarR family transcriptional regulator